ncbi:MAG: Crp/Fnr family transcriptional regulator [Planctomycetota bacterium]|nr:MAG: Crp/Fnr family transcriptional regulator [Planctomycetota bacterium]
MKTTSEHLQTLSLFEGLSGEELDKVARASSFRKFSPNEVIFSEGQFGNTWYVLLRGHVKISQMSEDGREKTLAIYTKGDFFGQVGLSTGLYYGASARAIQETEALLFSKPNFLKVILGNSSIVLQILERVSSHFHDYLVSTKDRTFERVGARLARVLVHYSTKSGDEGNEAVRFTHQELADIIGSTRETVSRTLKDYERQGLIAIGRKNIRIKNLRKLRQLF